MGPWAGSPVPPDRCHGRVCSVFRVPAAPALPPRIAEHSVSWWASTADARDTEEASFQVAGVWRLAKALKPHYLTCVCDSNLFACVFEPMSEWHLEGLPEARMG